jgi:hypothetical protein
VDAAEGHEQHNQNTIQPLRDPTPASRLPSTSTLLHVMGASPTGGPSPSVPPPPFTSLLRHGTSQSIENPMLTTPSLITDAGDPHAELHPTQPTPRPVLASPLVTVGATSEVSAEVPSVRTPTLVLPMPLHPTSMLPSHPEAIANQTRSEIGVSVVRPYAMSVRFFLCHTLSLTLLLGTLHCTPSCVSVTRGF